MPGLEEVHDVPCREQAEQSKLLIIRNRFAVQGRLPSAVQQLHARRVRSLAANSQSDSGASDHSRSTECVWAHCSFSFKIAACIRLFTVPTGMFNTSAASRYFIP